MFLVNNRQVYNNLLTNVVKPLSTFYKCVIFLTLDLFSSLPSTLISQFCFSIWFDSTVLVSLSASNVSLYFLLLSAQGTWETFSTSSSRPGLPQGLPWTLQNQVSGCRGPSLASCIIQPARVCIKHIPHAFIT